ncbi:MAG: SRPBCC family protein [Chitinophagaceae bacterium]
MQKESNPVGKMEDRGIFSARVLSWPKETVYNAFANPALLAKWWGPEGFNNTFQKFDLRPGGSWDFVMHGPGGKDYRNKSVFVSIAAVERVILDHLEPVHSFRMTISFDEYGTGTRLSFHMLFDDADECGRVKEYIIEGNEQNFDRLEALLGG